MTQEQLLREAFEDFASDPENTLTPTSFMRWLRKTPQPLVADIDENELLVIAKSLVDRIQVYAT